MPGTLLGPRSEKKIRVLCTLVVGVADSPCPAKIGIRQCCNLGFPGYDYTSLGVTGEIGLEKG